VLGGRERKSVDVTPELLADVDLVVVLVDHDSWPVELLRSCATPVFDAVNALGEPSRTGHQRL
jgi:hypothetical protein